MNEVDIYIAVNKPRDVRELKQTTTATVTPQNKRHHEQNNGCTCVINLGKMS